MSWNPIIWPCPLNSPTVGGGLGKVFLMMLKNADLVVWGIPKSMHFATDIFTWYSLQMILETEHLKIKSWENRTDITIGRKIMKDKISEGIYWSPVLPKSKPAEAGGHSARADTGWSGPGWGHLQCLQPAATQSLWQETVFNSSRWKFFSPSSLGNQDTFPLGALHRVEEKSLYSVGGRGPWGRLRTRCHQTRGPGPGRASSSPRTFCPACWGRACMGTWGGRAAGASGRSWAWFDVFLTGETFPNKSWRAWWASGKSCTALKRRKNEILSEDENPTSLNHRERKFLPGRASLDARK